MSDYRVIQPDENFKGKRYVEWVQDWSNWFYQSNPDHNNNGDVIFLRGMPLTGGNYGDEGVVMVGNNSLEIFADQRVLIPVITANYVADPSSQTSEWLYGMVRSHISGGDHPPHKEQLRINGKPIVDNNTEDDLRKYEIETPIFMISIPESLAGTSLKDQIEMPIQPSGFFPSVTRGYFVMLELYAGKEYVIESFATGATTEYGSYHTSMLYHIFVKDSREQKQLNIPPSRLSSNLLSKLHDQHTKGELDPKEYEKLKGFVEPTNEQLKKGRLALREKKENQHL